MSEITRHARDIQYLYSDIIYRFNAEFSSLWETNNFQSTDGINSNKAIAVPVFFSKSTRTFHWVSIANSMWDWSNHKRELKELINKLREYKNKYEDSKENPLNQYLSDMPNMDPYIRAKKTINHWITSDDPVTEYDWEDLHRSCVILYSGYHQRADHGIEGVFYRFLTECKKNNTDRDYVVGKLLPDIPIFGWLQIDNDTGYCCRDKLCQLSRYQNLYDPKASSDTEPENLLCEVYKSDLVKFAEETFIQTLLLSAESFDESLARSTLSERLGKSRNIVIAPVHDVQVGKRGYGGLKAIILIFFNSETDDRTEWLKFNHQKLIAITRPIAEEVTASAEVLATSVLIQPPYDLLHHFLKVLIYVQDWESAVVFKSGEFQYGFKREKPQDVSCKQQWLRYDQKGKFYDLRFATKPTEKPIDKISEISERSYLWWTGNNSNLSFSLWTTQLIPSLETEEIESFDRFSIRFEFPKAMRIPADINDQKWLRDEYLREQLDLMNLLVPKVRARRSALRNAAASIIGRNMSHNIGSHVLARYSSTKENIEDRNKFLEDRNQFLSYLQERMDFIAEITTTDVYFQMPIMLYDDAVKSFNNQNILLKYITGIQALSAKIQLSFNSGVDHFFSCPSGRTGLHALYVIFENIIRNTAKHSVSCKPNLKVEVLDSADSDRIIIHIIVTFDKACGGNWKLKCTSLSINQADIDYCGQQNGNWLARLLLTNGLNTFPAKPEGYCLKVSVPSNALQDKNTWKESVIVEHADTSVFNDSSLKINIRVEDWKRPDTEWLSVTLWDKKQNGCSEENKKQNGCSEEVPQDRITKESRKPLHSRLNKFLQQPLIDNAGAIIQDGWGVREIQLAAAYLRGIPMKDLEGWIPYGEPGPILEALPVNDDGLPCCCSKITEQDVLRMTVEQRCTRCEAEEQSLPNLGYRFYLRKAQILLSTESKSKQFGFKSPLPGVQVLPDSRVPGLADLGTSQSFMLIDSKIVDKLEPNAKARLPLLWFEGKGKPDDGGIDYWLVRQWLELEGGGTPNPIPVFIGDSECKDKTIFASDKDCSSTSNSPADWLVFEHHGWFRKTWDPLPAIDGVVSMEAMLKAKEKLNKDPCPFYYLEQFGSSGPQYSLICQTEDSQKQLYRNMFVAAAISRVVLLDERVQGMLQSLEMPSFENLVRMGIWVPSKIENGIDLDDPDSKAIDRWLTQLDMLKDKPSHRKETYLVIHQGIIDKLNHYDKNFEVTTLAQWVNLLNASNRFIVCSGRGNPRSSLPEGARFIPISSVLEWTIRRPSKFHLIYTLVHAKRPPKVT